MELMELENIVANTVYIKAKEGGPDNNKGRSKKWRKLLAFPHISQCVEIQVNVRMDRARDTHGAVTHPAGEGERREEIRHVWSASGRNLPSRCRPHRERAVGKYSRVECQKKWQIGRKNPE